MLAVSSIIKLQNKLHCFHTYKVQKHTHPCRRQASNAQTESNLFSYFAVTREVEKSDC